MSPPDRPARAYWLLLAACGLAGSMLLFLVGNSSAPHLAGVYWPWVPPLSASRIGHGNALAAARVGLGLLILGWLLALVQARRHPTATRGLAVVAGIWALPLVLAPPTFSDDVYAYAASGSLQVHGFDPYLVGPNALGAAERIISAVSPTWSATPTPYGPGFLGITRAVAAVSGAHDMVAVMLLRLVAIAAAVVTTVLLLRLARELARPGALVMWLVALNPLVLLSVVSGAHNETLMLAPLTGAFLLHRRGRSIPAIALSLVAAEIKVIALAATAALIIAHVHRSDRPRARSLLLVGSCTAAAFTIVTVVLGLPLGHGATAGFGFVRALSVPGRVWTTVTPVDALWDLLRGGRGGHHLLGLLRTTAAVLGLVGGAVVLSRARRLGPERATAALLLVALVAGVAFWPWYLLWPLPLVAVAGTTRERITVAVLSAGLLFVDGPGGQTLWGQHGGYPSRTTAEVLTLALTVGVGCLLLWRRPALSRVIPL